MLITLMFSLLACLVATAVQQPPRAPDVNAQRQAMKRLGFLVGQWQGQGRMLRAPGEWIEFSQTEHGEYKLDGLLLVIEGEGRAKSDGRLVLQGTASAATTMQPASTTCVLSTTVVGWKATSLWPTMAKS